MQMTRRTDQKRSSEKCPNAVPARRFPRRLPEVRCAGGPTCGGRARQRDRTLFERLAQRVEHMARELGQLVEEQRARVGQRLIGTRDREHRRAHWGRLETPDDRIAGGLESYRARVGLIQVGVRDQRCRHRAARARAHGLG